MEVSVLKFLFKSHKELALHGRYIHNENILPLLKKLDSVFDVEQIGSSVNGLPIHSVTLGHGNKKILIWSQMHGNESTTTKAVFDMFGAFGNTTDDRCQSILSQCTIKVVPILNPDGAKAYTRLNANEIDLNRDAQDLSQPESKVLRRIFDEFQPDYCFNLHGQRTIYSVGSMSNSAVVSFLAPAQDEERSITKTRKIAMSIIVKMNENLQKQIKDHVGIYDDAFNLDCVGDTFQSLSVPTVLFEAGHYPNDYQREQTREYIFQSLMVAINSIANSNAKGDSLYKDYLLIPNNEKRFYDVVIRNANGKDIAIQYEERLVDQAVEFVAKIEKISTLKDFYGHAEIDANGHKVFDENNNLVIEGSEIVFVLINNEKFSFNV